MQVQLSFLPKPLSPNERNRSVAVGVVWLWDTVMAEGARPCSTLVEDWTSARDIRGIPHPNRMPSGEQRKRIVVVIDGEGIKARCKK